MSKVKDEERILKRVREKHLLPYKGTSIRLIANFSAKTKPTRIKCHNQEHCTWQSYHSESEEIKEFSTQAKAKGDHHHKPTLQETLKGLF